MNHVENLNANTDNLENLIRPEIYSKRAIYVFSILFSSIFGGVLLMQNLKDTGKKKEGNMVLIASILYTVFTIILIAVFHLKNTFPSLLCNLGGAVILTEYFYKKYFPDEADYDKKKIWTPLIIGVIITIVFILLIIFAMMVREGA